MKNIITICAATLCLLLATVGCKNNSSFKVEGDIAGAVSTNLHIVYPGNDVLNNVMIAARDGKFTFEGRSDEPTMVQILDNEYNLIGFLYAENGDNIKVHISGRPLAISAIEGNDVNLRLSKWLTANADILKSKDSSRINKAIAAYAGANHDDIVSSMLVVSLYDAQNDPVGALQLLENLSPQARPGHIVEGLSMGLQRVAAPQATGKVKTIEYLSYADSMASFKPATAKRSLLVFTGEVRHRADTLLTGLRTAKNEGANVVEFTLSTDTFTWRASVRDDSTTWTHGWIPGGLSAPTVSTLGIPTLPFFIVTDGTGRQLYRGASLTAARAAL